MTIHELLQAAGLTANDEIPIWDADGTGEPTKKITAQQLAAAVTTLANLVTSVNNQTGAVSITPANIGAVDADALTIKPWGVNGESILANNGIYARSYKPNILPSQGAPTGFSEYASALSITGSEYPIVAYIDVFGNLAIWNSVENRWQLYHRDDYVYGITEGGTGATDAPGARANLGITPANIGAVAKTGDTITGVLNVRNSLKSNNIELIPTVGATNGGYIDFAYGGEEVDNTSRIIEGQRGVLYVNGIPFDTTNPVIGVPYGGTGATTPDGARSNLGALGSNATRVMFGGSATNFYQNLGAEISTMTDEEAQIFVVTVDSTDEPFYQWHTYSGTIVRYANATCAGILTDQTAISIAIGCNGGTWSVRSL